MARLGTYRLLRMGSPTRGADLGEGPNTEAGKTLEPAAFSVGAFLLAGALELAGFFAN